MLTKEQERIFEENKKLVYYTINKYIKNPGQYGLNDYEDIESMGMFALCKAIVSYNGQISNFSTYAVNVIRNHLYNELRDANETSDDSLSLSDDFTALNADLAYDNVTTITEEDIYLKQGIDVLTACGQKYGGIAEKGVEAIKLSLMGYNSTDIAEMFNVTPNLVTSWMSRAKQKLQKEPAVLKLLNKI